MVFIINIRPSISWLGNIKCDFIVTKEKGTRKIYDIFFKENGKEKTKENVLINRTNCTKYSQNIGTFLFNVPKITHYKRIQIKYTYVFFKP